MYKIYLTILTNQNCWNVYTHECKKIRASSADKNFIITFWCILENNQLAPTGFQIREYFKIVCPHNSTQEVDKKESRSLLGSSFPDLRTEGPSYWDLLRVAKYNWRWDWMWWDVWLQVMKAGFTTSIQPQSRKACIGSLCSLQ